MDSLLRAFWRLLAVIGRVERLLGIGLIGLIVVIISLQVVTRYAFNRPIVWVEDVATFAFIWAAFIGAAVGLKESRHIRIDTFVGRLGLRPRALVQAALYGIVLVCCVLLARYAWMVMDVERRSSTISLPINLPRHLFYSVPLFVGLVSMAATAVYFLLALLVQAGTGRPVDADVAAAEAAARERALDEAEARLAEQSLAGP